MSKEICLVDHCDNFVKAKGYCSRHYSQIRRTGQLIPLEKERDTTNWGKKTLCKAEECKRETNLSCGYCKKHYQQVRRHGRITEDRITHEGCRVDNCQNKHYSQEYCEKHFKRIKKYGTLTPTEEQRKALRKKSQRKVRKEKCQVEECKNFALGRKDFCEKHIWRLKTYGSLDLPKKPKIKCATDDCIRIAKTGLLCHTCYERKRRRRKKLATAKIEREKLINQGINVCTIETCPNRVHSRGLCSSHRKRRDNNQSLTDPPNSISMWQAEIFLEACERFGKGNVTNNDRTIIRNPKTRRMLELDVVVRINNIPRIAVEINGPAHYKPIHGTKALKDQQERDFIKKKICREKKITLLVIRTNERPKWPVLEEI
jgi:hypothetical protein